VRSCRGLVGGLRLLVAPKLLGAGVPDFAGTATTLHLAERRAWPENPVPALRFSHFLKAVHAYLMIES